jgi:glycogen debranching enzyme
MPAQDLTMVAGTTFVVSDASGDISPHEEQGIFASDTRFLSCFALRLSGQAPSLLRSGPAGFSEVQVYATNAESAELPSHTIELQRRRRLLRDQLVETIALVNRATVDCVLPLTLAFDADFADLFEVRGIAGARPRRRGTGRTRDQAIVFSDSRGGRERQTRIWFSRAPASVGRGRARFLVSLEPGERWSVDVNIAWQVPQPATHRPVPIPRLIAEESVLAWLDDVPALEAEDRRLQLAYQRAVRDLAALEIALNSGYPIPAAGLPWYLAIFGRDAIITSLQTLMLGARHARGTLRTLAAYQATEDEPFRDARSGKIAHEIRFGELASSGQIPHARYYGTADATPLWLMLLAEYERWTHDRQLVEELLPAAELALAWIDDEGDLDGDGFVEYQRRSEHGLQNQGWKDSWDSVRFADGRFAEGPIALVEVQGYVHAAKRDLAGLYALLGRDDDARRLRDESAQLKRQIHEAFWLPGEGYYALALDGRKRPVDSLTSNPGHLLWTGAVDEPFAGQVVARLLSPELFSGWGIRTMATTMRAFNPISYHNGSVWPHDNSLIAAGLCRYGYAREARTLVDSLLEATQWFDQHRLPELFCGYDRSHTPFPVDYPVACSPQAWAAGAVILMLQSLAGIRPAGDELRSVSPALDGRLQLRRVPFRGARVDLEVHGRRAT